MRCLEIMIKFRALAIELRQTYIKENIKRPNNNANFVECNI